VYDPSHTAIITLRWSAWCDANWASIDVPDWGDSWYVQSSDGTYEYSSGGTWTFMVNGSYLARACIYAPGFAGRNCTAWY
jgi:hypothetical protein